MTRAAPSPPHHPARVAVIGPRAAGKTTLLAMLYRESLAGRFGNVHLHAADSRSAAYLADTALDLDRGVPPEATGKPFELHLTLERGGECIALAVTDGAAPRGCDAVWLCLPAAAPTLDGVDLEAALSAPLAVILTKADELAARGPEAVRAAGDPFAGHPLSARLAKRATFAVTSTGPAGALPDGRPVLPTPLAPAGLETPLVWLADTLHREAPAEPAAPAPRSWGWSAVAAICLVCALCALWATSAGRWTPETPPDGDTPTTPDKSAQLARAAREAEAAREARAREALTALEKSAATLPERIQQAEAMLRDLAGAPPTNETRALLVRLRKSQADIDAKALAAKRKQMRIDGVAAYVKLREKYRSDNGDVKGLREAARRCIDADPDGPHAKAAGGVLHYCDALEKPGEYRVTLVSGVFSKKTAFALSTGVKLSVKLEVGGETYGPSAIGPGGYYPEWNWEFPRRVRWKPGDAIRILVTDHYLWKRSVSDTTIDEAGSIRRLDDSVEIDKGTLNFDTDFPLPRLPRVD